MGRGRGSPGSTSLGEGVRWEGGGAHQAVLHLEVKVHHFCFRLTLKPYTYVLCGEGMRMEGGLKVECAHTHTHTHTYKHLGTGTHVA